MGRYATNDEIVEDSPNVSAIASASETDLNRWANEAYIRVNVFCHQKFDFEQQTTKSVAYTWRPDVNLPKVLSGDVTAYSRVPGETPTLIDNDLETEFEAGTYAFRYNLRNVVIPSTSLMYLDITADWGYPASKEVLLVAYANDLKALYATHRAETDYHLVADGVNVVIAADATDTDSAVTLLNDIKAKYNAHAVSTTYHSEADTALVTASDATDEDSAVTLAEDLKLQYNAHVASTTVHLVEDENLSMLSVDNPILPEEIKLAFIKVVQRLAIRDNPDDLRYHNSGFASESWGDGYSYSLANADLRQPIHPSDAVLLWDHINHGNVVS